MSRANGKIILFGEHSVLYGGGAIGLRLKKTYVEVKISKNNYDYIESSFYSGRIENIDDVCCGVVSRIEITTIKIGV